MRNSDERTICTVEEKQDGSSVSCEQKEEDRRWI